MDENKSMLKLLEEINITLQSIDNRLDTKETFSDSEKLIDKLEKRVEYSTIMIQSTFDRIHDKVFNFNNIMIAAYLALGTFPVDSPIIKLWTIVFPISNLIFLIIIEIRQMEIHRFASREMEWTSKERDDYGKRINKQTLLSLGSMIASIIFLLYILLNL